MADAKSTEQQLKNVIGISRGKYKNLNGLEITTTGTEKDLVGKGEGLKDYEEVIVRLTMMNRPSSNPLKRDGTEGVPSEVSVIKKFNVRKMTDDSADLHNKHIAWRIGGNPNEFLWLIPAGKVKAGDNLKFEVGWTPIEVGGEVINYNFELKILPEVA